MHHQAINIARALLRIPSLTPVSTELRAGTVAALDLVEQVTAQTDAQCHKLSFEGGHDVWGYAVDNLYVVWLGHSDYRHLCFLGHVDVVPPGDLSGLKQPSTPFTCICHCTMANTQPSGRQLAASVNGLKQTRRKTLTSCRS